MRQCGREAGRQGGREAGRQGGRENDDVAHYRSVVTSRVHLDDDCYITSISLFYLRGCIQFVSLQVRFAFSTSFSSLLLI